MVTTAMQLQLSATDREDLERMVRATSAPAVPARQARSILLLAEGHGSQAVVTPEVGTVHYPGRGPPAAISPPTRTCASFAPG